MSEKTTHPYTWRQYQKRLRRSARIKDALARFPLYGFYAGGAIAILVALFFVGTWILNGLDRISKSPVKQEPSDKEEPRRLEKQDLPGLLENLTLSPSPQNYVVPWEGKKLSIEMGIDWQLQEYIERLLEGSQTHMAAVLVLRSDNGQVLAMAEYSPSENGDREHLFLKADYPAASLFKIISAAAAIEARDFTPEKSLFYVGRKHTLYKRQLEEKKNRYAHEVTFEKAFSGSINPVFGKMGIYDLGRDLISEYAERFLFNHRIPFDLPVENSRIQVPEDAFGLAEIASGFNKRTLISPLHAALITAGVANGGIIMEPWLVRRVTDNGGDVLYQVKPRILGSPISRHTAEILKILMEDTVISGTGRKTFRGLRRKKSFKGIALGAKTGTINDKMDQYKYDWITIFAIPQSGKEGISLAVLAVHGEKLGIRAKDIGRLIIVHHFSS